MKRIHLLLCSVLLLGTFNANAQTTVPAGLVSGNWTLAGSPYIVQGGIMIANGTTLSIDPGVTVNFQGSYIFLVMGRLIAIGTLADTITFTATNTNIGWLGIRFNNTLSTNDTSKFFYCKLKYGRATAVAPNDCGGGFYFDSFSKAVISHSRISDCYATTFGGGIYCINSSNPPISYNVISNNNAVGGGGGIYCYNSSNPIISNNIISYNIVNGGSGGGGIYAYNSSSPSILYNTITHNNSGRGGGIFCIQSSATISHNTIAYNQAANDWGGGAIYTSGSGTSETISYNIISNNTALNSNGGAVFCGSQTLISNNVISNNSSTNNGGAIYSYMDTPTIINNTISNNSATLGNSLFCTSSSNPILRNSILWNSVASNQIYLDDDTSDPAIFNCDIQGGQAGIGLNTNVFYLGAYSNNINADPIFIAPSGGSGTSFNGVTANWTLQGNSPCVNAGSPSGSYPSTDLSGNPRVLNGIIDMGAYEILSVGITNYEFQSQLTIYPNPFTSQTKLAFSEAQENLTIKIIDILGKEIKTINFTGIQIVIDKAEMKEGIYFVQIIDEQEHICNRKFIIL